MVIRSLAWILFPILPGVAPAQPRFYPDDPLEREPAPLAVQEVKRHKLDDLYDLLMHTLTRQGQFHTRDKLYPAQGVNTLGDVPDGPWTVKRHYYKPMSLDELAAGPGNTNPPSQDGEWTIVSLKTQGVTPGFGIRDSQGRRYLLKFDPATNPEMATAADVITSKFFHALGYHVPENYIVTFDLNSLKIDKALRFTDPFGKQRAVSRKDIAEVLLNTPRLKNGRYRAVASRFLAGQNIGEFRYYKTRTDDPNDVVPHEHRRDLRGLYVFCAWLAHDDSRAVNTLDLVVEEDGRRFIRHHLIDFGSTLGSASTKANPARSGNTYLLEWRSAATEFFSLGLYVPAWARAQYPKLPSVGRFESKVFNPERYYPEYPNPAFRNRLPDDEFWAAKQVMAFSDEQIRAIVKTGQFSDPRAEDWVIRTLIERRDKIGRVFFAKVLPLDKFAIRDGRLAFEDLAARYRFTEPRSFQAEWFRFDNQTSARNPVAGSGLAIPPELAALTAGQYFGVTVRSGDPKKTVTAYWRSTAAGPQLVGIDRTW